MSKPVIAWSHSALESFETCPKKHYHTRIAKDVVVDWSGEAVVWGRDVHEALDRRLRIGAELPSNMAQYEKHAAKMERLADKLELSIHTELQLAVDQQLKPCGWKDWNNCWGRAALDLFMMHPFRPDAVAIDWKTGKRKANDQQLVIQAVLAMLKYPHVNKVVSGYCWLKEAGEIDSITLTRDKMKPMLKSFLPKVRALTDAAIHGDWPTKPSGLCAQYCEVATCKHNGSYHAKT